MTHKKEAKRFTKGLVKRNNPLIIAGVGADPNLIEQALDYYRSSHPDEFRRSGGKPEIVPPKPLEKIDLNPLMMQVQDRFRSKAYADGPFKAWEWAEAYVRDQVRLMKRPLNFNLDQFLVETQKLYFAVHSPR